MMMAALSLTACYHDVHDYLDPSSGMGYLTASLSYEYPEDVEVPLDNICIRVLDDGATESTNDFDTRDDAASWLKHLAVGEYDVLITQDMLPADGYELKDGVVRLAEPASSPDQSWYAMAHVTITSDRLSVADLQLKRLMATLQVNISNVPDGVGIGVTVDHMAAGVDLMKDDDGGRLGRPSDDYIAVPLTMASGGSATRTVSLTSGMHSLLPTSAAYDRTDLSISITTAEGKELFCIGDTPRMESGHTYIIDLDYTKLQPYMYFEWYRINDWVEGAVINGAVELPEEEK